MVALPSPIARFRDRVLTWDQTWGALDIRCFCLRQGDAWRNVLSHVRLLAGNPEEYEPLSLQYGNGDFAIFQEIVDFARFGSLLDELGEDSLRVGERVVSLDAPHPSVTERIGYTYTLRAIERRWAREQMFVSSDYYTMLLEGRGRSVAEFATEEEFEKLKATIVASEIPFNGLGDVVTSLFYSVHEFDVRGNSAQISIVAPAYARMESVEEQPGRILAISISGPPRSTAADFRLGVIMRTLRESPVRKSIGFEDAEVTNAKGYFRAMKRVQLIEAHKVELFLLYKSDPVDSATMLLPVRNTANPRFTAHLVFDHEGAKLRELLFPRPERPVRDSLELGVSWLLYLCGFQVVSHGLSVGKLNDEIDDLAFVPLSNLAVAVECTGAELNPEKLIKLANRCNQLRKALPEVDLVAVAMTSLEEVTPVEKKTAADLQIAILTKPMVQELLGLAESNVSAREVFHYFRSKIAHYL